MEGSDNAQSAENQQERFSFTGWTGGFRRWGRLLQLPHLPEPSRSLGWQVQPAFAVVQGESSRDVLEDMVAFFGCGRVYVNRRKDNHREDLYRYCVYRYGDLRDIIVPFFLENPLRTAKRDNFAKFARIIELMDQRRHLTVPGLIEIAEIAETMNFRKPSEALKILRGHTPTLFSVS